jgi:hypothetical protein
MLLPLGKGECFSTFSQTDSPVWLY